MEEEAEELHVVPGTLWVNSLASEGEGEAEPEAGSGVVGRGERGTCWWKVDQEG